MACGNVDFVARIISMFFMVTYGALCAISFLEHFAARPCYRPSFRSKWYLSLFGAVMCLFLMFQMDPVYALLAIIAMLVLYRPDSSPAADATISRRSSRRDDPGDPPPADPPAGPSHRARRMAAQRHHDHGRTFDRSAPLQMISWLSLRHGFGTYLHFIPGLLEPETYRES